MQPLLDQINQLGPWGVVLGAALLLLAQRLGVKLPGPLSPPAPKPAPEPTPVPVPAPVDPKPAPVLPDRPILNGLLSVLLAVLESQARRENKSVEAVVAEALPQLVKESEAK